MGTIYSIAVVEDGVMGELVTMLNTSLMVTGALLVGTGDCTIVGSTINIGESIRTTTIGKYFPLHSGLLLRNKKAGLGLQKLKRDDADLRV